MSAALITGRQGRRSIYRDRVRRYLSVQSCVRSCGQVFGTPVLLRGRPKEHRQRDNANYGCDTDN